MNSLAITKDEAMAFFRYVHESIGNDKYLLDNTYYNPNYFFNKPLNINLPSYQNMFLSLIRNRINIRYFKMDVIIPFLIESRRTYFLVNKKGKNTTFIFGYITNGQFVYNPYFSDNGYGILDKYIDENSPFPDFIPSILKDINKLLTFSSKCFSVDDESVLWDMMELYLLLITSERFRSDKSSLYTYIESFKVKNLNSREEWIDALYKMFHPVDPTLKFAKVGGVDNILNAPPEDLYQCFMDMINYIEIPYFHSRIEFNEFANNFYLKHLDRLKAIFENRYPEVSSNKKYYRADQRFSIANVKIWATPINKITFLNELYQYY